MTSSRRPRTGPARGGSVAFVLAALGSVACSNPTEIVLPPVEALVASGDSQYGTAGQTLAAPLQVVIRTLSTGLPREGVTVVWTVEEGDASIVGVAAMATDSAGSARTRVRLGQAVGPIRVRAQVRDQNPASAEFRVFLVARPVLSSVSPGSGAPGSAVTLTGLNFSPDPVQNVVLFSGIRGVVTAASATELTVTVPPCLPARAVSVTTQLGVVASAPLGFTTTGGGAVSSLAPGEVLDLEGDFACAAVPGDGSATYVLLAQSAGTVGAATHPFRLRGLSASGGPALLTASAAPMEVRFDDRDRDEDGTRSDPQAAFDEILRGIEREVTREVRVAAAQAGGPAAVPPAVGERRTFQVFRAPGAFTEVTAVAQHVGARAALFVDEQAPDGGLDAADLAAFSERFDGYIHPAVRDAFGAESDLDGNERVIILFTPAVNALTPRGSSGYVGGFFFGIDLLPQTQGSNGGEVFYTLVPDPDGIHSDPRSKQAILDLSPAILAHEFQHMVNFNERVLVRGAQANEAIWLSEGLAQYAEELVARAYEADGDDASAVIFRSGNRDRSRRYLAGTDTVSVVVSAGQGSLAERGAGLLHVMYLADRFGPAVVGDLTRTTATGVANVEAETGTDWGLLLSDWWSAVRLDGPGPELGPTVYPTVDLRGFLGDPFPLGVEDVGPGDFVRSGSLRSSSVAYYEVTPSAGGSMTVRLGGEGGGASTPQARLRLRIIRVQ